VICRHTDNFGSGRLLSSILSQYFVSYHRNCLFWEDHGEIVPHDFNCLWNIDSFWCLPRKEKNFTVGVIQTF
jgi:hypothetical protein